MPRGRAGERVFASHGVLHLSDDNVEARDEFYARAARAEHMHNFHYPDPLDPPNPSQPCAQLLKGTTLCGISRTATQENWYVRRATSLLHRDVESCYAVAH